MLVLEYAFHRQRAIDAGTGEIDIVGRPIGSLEPSALRAVEDSEAPGLQPAAVLKTHMDTVGLRLLAQRSLEQRDYAVEFAVLVDFRQGGMDCQDTNEGAQRGDIRLETAERAGAGGVHPGRGCCFRRSIEGHNLDHNETGGEHCDECDDGPGYRTSEAQRARVHCRHTRVPEQRRALPWAAAVVLSAVAHRVIADVF